MKITDCFERVCVINLPYKQDRRERLSNHVAEIGIADPDKLHWERAISGDQCWAPEFFKAGNGPWGCLQSHMRIVQDAIMDGIKNYLVLEDDAIFHPRAPEMLERLMEELPDDWGQLYLGGQHLQTPEELETTQFILRGMNVNRTHAFALNARTFARFQQHISHAPDYIEKDGGWHIDHQLGTAHERKTWNVYCPCWWLSGQEEGTSNISGNTNPRMWWNPEIYSGRLPFIWLDPAEERPGSKPAQAQEQLQDALVAAAADRADLLREHVHFGGHLKPGRYEDAGLDKCVQEIPDRSGRGEASADYRASDHFLPWLNMIAEEAISRGCLPGLQHPNISRKLLESLWPAGVIDARGADLAAMVDYPFNGLFPHPLADLGEKSETVKEGSSAA